MDINIVKLDNFNIDKITFSKSFFINSSKKQISIGYDDYTDLHILTPTFTNDINFYNIPTYFKLNFNPMLGPILNFYNIITNIENNIKSNILKNNPTYKLNSVLKNDNSDFIDDEDDIIKKLFLRLSKAKFYDHNSNECDLNVLQVGWKFKALIKIDYIWIDIINKKFGLNIELIQLKIIQPVSTIRCLIDDDYRYVPKFKIEIETETKTEYKPINNEIKSEIIKKPFIIPNPNELLNLKNALKKVLK
jgi:hypothetical protein